jgi:hypothetical protein
MQNHYAIQLRLSGMIVGWENRVDKNLLKTMLPNIYKKYENIKQTP